MPAVSIVTIWWTVGFNILLFLAGLKMINPEIYEASEIDGANTLHQFTFITFPLIWPITALVLTLQLIFQLKIFDQMYLFTQGGPYNKTMVVLYHVYKQAFMLYKGGYASAIALIIFLFPSLFLKAQERVKSLSIRQFEIEESIRNGLKYYLEPKDYVLRVKLFGEERAISVANETLPGFGQLNEASSATGAKYWEITRMRVDLVMHKEVSPSVNTYIGEIVPILSGIDYERGDELVFVPILPSEPFPQQSDIPSAEELPDSMAKALPEEATEIDGSAMQPGESIAENGEKPLEEEPFWMRMSDIEKILAGMLLVLLLLFFWVLWKLRKVKKVAVEQTGFPALMPPQPQTPQLPNSPHQGFVPLPESHEKIAENNEHHDYQIDDAMINDENEKLVQEIVKQLIGRVDWKQELVQEMSRDKQSMDMLTQFIATLGLSSSRKLFSETIPQNTFQN